jgi:hypothetical protein
MKNIVIAAIILILSGIVLTAAGYRAQLGDDLQLTNLVQKIQYSSSIQNFNRLSAGEKVDINFKAQYNNLGTVALDIDNYSKINTDWIWFRIKEKDSTSWIYQNKYNTDQFSAGSYFPFGFPVISNSQNKEYFVEIESVSGAVDNSISLNRNTPGFFVTYSYPKSYLMHNKSQILLFLKNKFFTYVVYWQHSDKNIFIAYAILPLLAWFIIFFDPSGLSTKLRRVESNLAVNRIAGIAVPAGIFILTVVISGYFSAIGADPHHDGILIKPAIDVASGKMLFRDTFTQYGALTTLVQAASLLVFGKYLIVIKLLTAFFYGLISIVLYGILKNILPKSLAFTTLIIWILIAPYYLTTFLAWSSVYALFFQLLGTLLLIRSFKKKSNKYVFLSGVSIALTFWCRQSVGAIIVLSVVAFYIYLLIFRQMNRNTFKKNLYSFLAGNISVHAIFFLWLIVNHALGDWWQQSIVFVIVFARWTNEFFGSNPRTFLSILFPDSVSLISIWSVLPITSIIVFLRNMKNKTIVLLSFVGLASWHQYYPSPDAQHTYWSATLMLVLFVLCLYQIIRDFFIRRFRIPGHMAQYLVIIFCILFFRPDIAYRINMAANKMNAVHYFIDQPAVLRHIALSKNEADFYEDAFLQIEKYFLDFPDGNVITTGRNALYLTFDLRIKNFNPMYVNWGLANEKLYKDYPNLLSRYIEMNKPLIIAFSEQLPPGYCIIDNKINYDSAFLIKSCK